MAKARAAVAVWRAEYPQGTPDQMVDTLGRHFHPDWSVVLRALLYVADKHAAREITGVISGPAGAVR